MLNLFKWILLIALFSPVFYFAFRQKKWYLFLTCAFIGILPDEFALELSSSLPLLTAQRVLILILLGFWIVKKWKEKKWFTPLSLVIFFCVQVLISVVNFRFGIGGEIKRIALMLFEQVLLVIMLADFIDDRKDLDRCVDMMLLSCAALSVIGICQTIFDFDIASVLQLVNPRSSTGLTPRMELTRAFGMSNAIIFGCYCTFMALLCFYRLERTGKHRYSLILALDVVALLCTMSRSAWLCFCGLAALLLLTRPVRFVRRVWVSLLVIVVLCTGLFFANGKFGEAVLETGKSSLNTVLSAANIHIPGLESGSNLNEDPDFTQPEEPDHQDVPQFDISDKFGLNAGSAADSRLVEWTAVLYMAESGHLLFGYGYNAFPRGMLHYFYPQFGFWTVARTLDVGLLATITESGLFGLLAELSLLCWVAYLSLRALGKRGTFTFGKVGVYAIGLYLLMNFMAAISGPIWIFIGLVYASTRLTREGMPDTGEAAGYEGFQF